MNPQSLRDRVAWAARGQTGFTRQRGPMGACPPHGLTPEAMAALNANAAAFAGQDMVTSSMDAAVCTQNVNDNRFPCQAGMCAEQPPVCGCNVIGGNTFALFPNGVPSGGTVPLAIDAGDSCRYQPRSLFLVAFEADPNNTERLTSPCTSCPVLLTNAAVGSIPMIRRTGQTSFGIISQAYSDRKELTCVDWAPFTSVNNQGLTLTFLQIGANAQHVFSVLWGDNLG